MPNPIDEQLNTLEGQINSALGASHTPGTQSCHFWTGNQSSNCNGMYHFQNGRDGWLIEAGTKEELLKKMRKFYREKCCSTG